MSKQTLLPLVSALIVFFLQANSFAEKPRIYQKETQVKSQAKPQAAQVAASTNSPDDKERIYETNKWVVREEIDEVEKVNDALKVFQSRKAQVYDRKVWIYNKVVDNNDVFVDFVTSTLIPQVRR